MLARTKTVITPISCMLHSPMTIHILGCVICCARHCHQLNPLSHIHIQLPHHNHIAYPWTSTTTDCNTHIHRAGARTHNLAGWAHTPAWKKPLWEKPSGKNPHSRKKTIKNRSQTKQNKQCNVPSPPSSSDNTSECCRLCNLFHPGNLFSILHSNPPPHIYTNEQERNWEGGGLQQQCTLVQTPRFTQTATTRHYIPNYTWPTMGMHL